jgi:hypothetical protein
MAIQSGCFSAYDGVFLLPALEVHDGRSVSILLAMDPGGPVASYISSYQMEMIDQWLNC